MVAHRFAPRRPGSAAVALEAKDRRERSIKETAGRFAVWTRGRFYRPKAIPTGAFGHNHLFPGWGIRWRPRRHKRAMRMRRSPWRQVEPPSLKAASLNASGTISNIREFENAGQKKSIHAADGRAIAFESAVRTAGSDGNKTRRRTMNGLIYLVGLIVVILAVLSFFGLR